VRYRTSRVAYAIERNESLHAAVLRIMDELIVRARETLADADTPAEKRIHETRKRFKEIRALLRLVRDPLGEHFAHENAWFRDAARELAAARDAVVVGEALEKLELSAAANRSARKVLDARRESHPPLEPLIVNVLDQLVIAQGRVGMWPEIDDSFDAIAPGLLRTYRGGRQAMLHHESAEELHEWRKRVKEHWYHAQLLRQVWPEMMKPYADVLSTLSKALGEHHDLHVLRGMLAASGPKTSPRTSGLATTLSAIDARQAELEEQAMRIGRRVYAEKPTAWLARMRNVWKAWTRTAP
jgi:CHAD domain-containing protein